MVSLEEAGERYKAARTEWDAARAEAAAVVNREKRETGMSDEKLAAAFGVKRATVLGWMERRKRTGPGKRESEPYDEAP